MENTKKLYRVEPTFSGQGYSEDYGYFLGVQCKLQMREYDIVSETAKGVWISLYGYITKKWVSNSAKKRFAYPTPKEALEAFKHRNKSYIRILKRKLDWAEMAKNRIEEFEKTL